MIQDDFQRSNDFYSTKEEEGIITQKILFKFLHNWYYFLVAICITGAVAFLYIKISTPIYEINAKLLVEDDKNSSSLGAGGIGYSENIFQGLGIMNSMRNIHNQIVVVGSSPVIYRTLDKLDFEISYYSEEGMHSSEIYTDSPFQVVWDKNHQQVIETDYYLTIQPNKKLFLSTDNEDAAIYDYSNNEDAGIIPEFSFSKEIDSGTNLVSDHFSFKIILKDWNNEEKPSQYRFRFHSRRSLVERYQRNLTVELSHKETSIIDLSVKDLNVSKGIAFLNKLTEVYQFDNLNKKNENASRTIHFISSQLATISDSLNVSESQMENFQRQNQILNISLQSQQLLEQMNDMDRERVELEAQNKYYHYLRDYIIVSNSQKMETAVAPSAMGIHDPLLNNLILQLNELIIEKSSQTSIRHNSQHPIILKLNAKIKSVRSSLQENVDNIISQSDMALRNLNERIHQFDVEIRRLPATERNYVNIERRYKLNNETYTFLLQKLSKAQIAKASNIPDSQIIEEPKMSGSGPVEPQKKKIFALTFILGLAFPAGLIILFDLLNNKITSKEDIETITNYPVIGHVFQNTKEYSSNTLVLDKPNSPASEPYSAILTKLELLTNGKNRPVIAVTSAFPDEGKTYNAINIASLVALMNKTAVILDLDLRNSCMAQKFGITPQKSIVDYIIGRANLEEITYDTKHSRLKIIPVGPLPPNPVQILTNEKLAILLEELKNIYNIVVIDTPPVGIIADYFHLRKMIDTSIFVVRHKITLKYPLKLVFDEIEKHQINEVGIIINSVSRNKKKYCNGYGYGYGYGYGKNKEQNDKG